MAGLGLQEAHDAGRACLGRAVRVLQQGEVLAHEWMRENGAAAGERELQPEILSRMRNFAGLNRLKKEALRVRWGMG